MRYLVTGGAGYLGSLVVADLLRAVPDCSVTVLDVGRRGYAGLAALLDDSRLEVVAEDLLLWRPREKYDAVLHLAGVVGEAAVARDPETAYLVNVEGAKRALDWAYEVKNVVVFSTCSIYHNNAGLPYEKYKEHVDQGRINTLGWREDDNLVWWSLNGRILNTYVDQKRLLDTLTGEAGATVLRPGTAVGWSPNVRWDLFANAAVRAALRGEPFDVYQGDAARPWASTRWISRCARELAGRGGVWNVVSCNLTKLELLEYVRGVRLRIAGSGDARDYRADREKAWTEFRCDEATLEGNVILAMDELRDRAHLS